MEILAPAGSYESVVAAVMNGANAVYLGQQKFNARQNAENFDYDTLKQAVEYCHLHGVLVYQTLNTILFDDEIEELQETLRIACELCVDALIVQDFGVLRLIKETCPTMPIHGSTQMSVHTQRGAKLMKEMGLSRVVLAREMSLDEIAEIARNVEIELEVFGHGALCMSVSGQCYMSAAIGGRSGNKGNCAGTCRLPFGVENIEDYDLSLKDLCAIKECSKLEQLGVVSLKIEGRMKRPEYVAAAVRAYREALEGGKVDTEQLKAVFSRAGFTNGYLLNKRGNDMFGTRGKEDVTAATAEVLQSLQETYRKEKATYPLNMLFVLKANEPAKLTVSDNTGLRVEILGDVPEVALNKSTTQELVQESIEKLGGTVYFSARLETRIDDGLMLSKAKLNEMRRRAVEELNLRKTTREIIPFTKIEVKKSKSIRAPKQTLRARFDTCRQIPFSHMKQLDYIYLPLDQVVRYANVLLPYQSKVILEVNRVMFGDEEEIMERLCSLKKRGFDKIAASNPAHIQIAKELGFTVFGTAFLNVTNSFSVKQYESLGVEDVVLSTELTMKKSNYVQSNKPAGIMAYGYLPLMLVRNCPVKRHMTCGECGAKQSLTDRLGNHFPVVCTGKRYSEILNCNRLYLADKLEDFTRADFFVLYFTTEEKADCEAVITQYLEKQPAEGDFTRGLYYRGIV